MPTQPKVSPDTANLRAAQGDMSCATCANFQPPNMCSVVEGTVAPDMLSDLYISADIAGNAVTGPDEGIMDMLGGIA